VTGIAPSEAEGTAYATPGLGMQENQHVVFLSDGGDSVRNLQEYLHPASEHWLDWFQITMRLTVLQQQTKGFTPKSPSSARRSRAS
jgi:hypothetical protein